MPVPKMVKNGFDSALEFFCLLEMGGSCKEIKNRYDAKSCPKIPKRE
jgi:hypothetical protein